MASFNAQVAQAEQVGRVDALEGHFQDAVNKLQRLQSVIAQNAQHAQNVQNNQNGGQQFVPPPSPPPSIRPNLNLPEPP